MKAKVFFPIVMGLLVLNFSTAKAQVIKGHIFDASDNTPLSGAIIQLKGTNIVSVADISGNYQIQLDSLHQTLIFSFLGYQNKEVKVLGRKEINIGLQANTLSMEESVVVGYAEKEKTMDCISHKTVMAGQLSGIQIRGSSKKACTSQSTVYLNEDNYSESYAKMNENGFMQVSKNPLSTFSIDVDAASYSNIRRYINNGSLPPADAVRIEEMINYFNYNYGEPQEKDPFKIHTELATCPWVLGCFFNTS